jgi:hypothetical protein
MALRTVTPLEHLEDEPEAALEKTRWTWLASAERQMMRSEASWVLCDLARF